VQLVEDAQGDLVEDFALAPAPRDRLPYGWRRHDDICFGDFLALLDEVATSMVEDADREAKGVVGFTGGAEAVPPVFVHVAAQDIVRGDVENLTSMF